MATHPKAAVRRHLFTAIRLAMRPGSPSLGQRAAAVPRMAKAVSRGSFVGSSKGRLAMMVAAGLYIISPVDLMPEAILGIFGLFDDAVVASWLATEWVTSTESFLAWEHEQAMNADPATQGHGQPAEGATVKGSVVP